MEYGGFQLMPGNQDLTAAEVRLLTMMAGREFKLRNALKPIREDYDVILIDCPPSLNMLTLNALVAADSVMVPMQCEYYALEGLSALVQTIDQIKGSINPELEIEGLLRTMFDPRNNLANEVSAQLIEHFGDKVFRTLIPRNIRLAEAPSFGKPALFHDKESRGALAYLALAGEMIRRDELPPAALESAVSSAWNSRMTGKKPSLGRGLAELSPLMARRAATVEQAAAPAGRRSDRQPAARFVAARQISAAARHAARDVERAGPIDQGARRHAAHRGAPAIRSAIRANRSATRSSRASGAGAPRRWRGSREIPGDRARGARRGGGRRWPSSRTSSGRT